MGAVDLVIQVESPTSVARGLQRVGRAGHQVGAPSKGVIFPKYRGDLLEARRRHRRMHEGAIETTTLPRNPLDVLAQQIVAMTRHGPLDGRRARATVVRGRAVRDAQREVLEGVLGMLAGAYPSDEFAELKPRIVWDRVTGVIEGRRDARVVAVTSGGTIPDRGLFGVFLVGEAGTPGRRVGELDEEMVYESRVGEVITLGRQHWRIEEIGHDRVHGLAGARRAGQAAVLARRRGRPADRARAGARARSSASSRPTWRAGPEGRRAALDRLRERPRPRRAGGREPGRLPRGRARGDRRPADRPADRRRALPRRARRLAAVHPDAVRWPGPRAVVAGARVAPRRAPRRRGPDDLVRRRDRDPAARRATTSTASTTLLFPDPDEIEDLVVGAGRRRRRCSRRASARTPPGRCSCRAAGPARGRRSGSSASARPTCSRSPAATARFPILVETYRECLSDVFDLPALRDVLAGVARREIAVHGVETAASHRRSRARCCSTTSRPTCTRATRRWPSAGPRRSPSTATCCASCSGQEELRELLDPEALADLELALQALTDDRRATTADQLHDLLRRLGDLSADEVAARVRGRRRRRPTRGCASSIAARRAVRVRIAGEERWIAIEDVARYRDARRRRAAGRACRRRSSARRRRRSTGCSRAGRGPTARS